MTSRLRETLARSVHDAARELVGWTFLVDGVGGRIVETEAYAPDDAASHSFAGRTARNATMFGPPGLLYVYRSYGVHWCANVVCCEEGIGAAVLVRALEPTEGIEVMQRRRGTEDVKLLCSGPGRLTEALGISGVHDGSSLGEPPFELRSRSGNVDIVAGPRVGISRAAESPWRYAVRSSAYVSRPRPPA